MLLNIIHLHNPTSTVINNTIMQRRPPPTHKLSEGTRRQRHERREREKEVIRRIQHGESSYTSPSRRRKDHNNEGIQEEDGEYDGQGHHGSKGPKQRNVLVVSSTPSVDDNGRLEEEQGGSEEGLVREKEGGGSGFLSPRRKSVELRFVNERMAAFLPGMNEPPPPLESEFEEEEQPQQRRERSRRNSPATRSPNRARSKSPSRLGSSGGRNKGVVFEDDGAVEQGLFVYDNDGYNQNDGQAQWIREIVGGQERPFTSRRSSRPVAVVPTVVSSEDMDPQMFMNDILLEAEQEEEEMAVRPRTRSKSPSSRRSRRKSIKREESRDTTRNESSTSLGESSSTHLNTNHGSTSSFPTQHSRSSSKGRNRTDVEGDDEDPPSRSRRSTSSRSSSRRSSPASYSRDREADMEPDPLPIEIPVEVRDEAAFRQYLSVRRGGIVDLQPFKPLLQDVEKSYESVGDDGGDGGLPPAMAVTKAEARADTQKKTSCLCLSIVSLALLSASASQLRFFVAYAKAHSYPALNYFLISISILIEIVAGIGFVVLSRFPSTDTRADNFMGVLIAGLFIVAIINVIISAFAFDDHVCEVLAKQTEIDVVDQSSV